MSTIGNDLDIRPVALITGGSRGIGFELAKQFARNQYDVVLVAHKKQLLTKAAVELNREFGCNVTPLNLDLYLQDSPKQLFRLIRDRGIHVDVLVNNAGIGVYGPFAESEIEKQLNMLSINILRLSEITHLFLPGMIERGKGRVINVASVVAFFAGGQNWASYVASKHYVLAFTKGLAKELSSTGVTMTALCPGPTTTDFVTQTGVGNTKVYRWLPRLNPVDVAVAGYRGAVAGKAVVIPGFTNKILAFLGELPPRGIAQAVFTFLSRESVKRLKVI